MQNLFSSSFLEREHCMVQYYWTEPPWFRIFRQRTFCGLALPGRIIQGSVWSDRTFSVHHFLRKNILWFSIIGQNLFGSSFLEKEHFMVQYYWTEPLWFRIFRHRTFCGLALSDRTMQGSVLPGRTLWVQHFWTGYILWFSIIGQNLFGSAFLDREPFVV